MNFKKFSLIALLLLTSCGGGGGGGGGDDQPQSVLRIMPLGDSITQAEGPQASYRYWLWNQLTEAGASFDFIGSKVGHHRGTEPYTNFDRDHQGHWDFRTRDVLAVISAPTYNYQPDIVLIHIGSNDMFRSGTVSGTIADIGSIIDRLRVLNPGVIIVLAKLIPSTKFSDRIAALNEAIPALASAKNTDASPVILVDQSAGFNATSDTYDGIHPDASGERKISSKFFEAIIPFL
jgi:acyl-CoA thioesterase I